LCFENCPAAFYSIQPHAICTNTKISRSVSLPNRVRKYGAYILVYGVPEFPEVTFVVRVAKEITSQMKSIV